MTPTPNQLAAAENIDVARYEGHTPWPWHFNVASGALTQTSHITRDVWFLPRVDPDVPLLEDSPLIPALVHQRDEARREVERLQTALMRIHHTGYDGCSGEHARCVKIATDTIGTNSPPEADALLASAKSTKGADDE